MTEISLYNTRSRTKEPLRPDRSGERADVCLRTDGLQPRPYRQLPAGGGLRPAVPAAAPPLRRGPRHLRAQRHGRGRQDQRQRRRDRARRSARSPTRPSTPTTPTWAALGVLPPDHQPRVTEYMDAIVAMIGTLIARGPRLRRRGPRALRHRRLPDYGKLSGRSIDEMSAGARVEVAPYKRHPVDFVLWKPSKPTSPAGTALGPRPAGLAHRVLGHDRGAPGRRVRHPRRRHRPRCSRTTRTSSPRPLRPPDGEYANVWMHNGFLNIEGEKMSKSLGNFFTVRDLLDRASPARRSAWRCSPRTTASRWTGRRRRWTMRRRCSIAGEAAARREAGGTGLVWPAGGGADALGDDLNTPLALNVLRDLVPRLRRGGSRSRVSCSGSSWHHWPSWGSPRTGSGSRRSASRWSAPSTEDQLKQRAIAARSEKRARRREASR